MRSGMAGTDAAAQHRCSVMASPWPGVFATCIESTRQYGRHWHATFGIGFMARGGHRSMSGCGMVDAHAGDVITSNPGEVHDGRPLGGLSRRWCMVYLDAAAMATMSIDVDTPASDTRLTEPVIR